VEIDGIRSQYPYKIENLLLEKQNQLKQLQNMIESNNPNKRVQRGFAQVLQDGKITELKHLEKNEIFELQNSDVVLLAKVIEKRKIK
jgi:exonuclease VII large subunit